MMALGTALPPIETVYDGKILRGGGNDGGDGRPDLVSLVTDEGEETEHEDENAVQHPVGVAERHIALGLRHLGRGRA